MITLTFSVGSWDDAKRVLAAIPEDVALADGSHAVAPPPASAAKLPEPPTRWQRGEVTMRWLRETEAWLHLAVGSAPSQLRSRKCIHLHNMLAEAVETLDAMEAEDGKDVAEERAKLTLIAGRLAREVFGVEPEQTTVKPKSPARKRAARVKKVTPKGKVK